MRDLGRKKLKEDLDLLVTGRGISEIPPHVAPKYPKMQLQRPSPEGVACIPSRLDARGVKNCFSPASCAAMWSQWNAETASSAPQPPWVPARLPRERASPPRDIISSGGHNDGPNLIALSAGQQPLSGQPAPPTAFHPATSSCCSSLICYGPSGGGDEGQTSSPQKQLRLKPTSTPCSLASSSLSCDAHDEAVRGFSARSHHGEDSGGQHHQEARLMSQKESSKSEVTAQPLPHSGINNPYPSLSPLRTGGSQGLKQDCIASLASKVTSPGAAIDSGSKVNSLAGDPLPSAPDIRTERQAGSSSNDGDGHTSDDTASDVTSSDGDDDNQAGGEGGVHQGSSGSGLWNLTMSLQLQEAAVGEGVRTAQEEQCLCPKTVSQQEGVKAKNKSRRRRQQRQEARDSPRRGGGSPISRGSSGRDSVVVPAACRAPPQASPSRLARGPPGSPRSLHTLALNAPIGSCSNKLLLPPLHQSPQSSCPPPPRPPQRQFRSATPPAVRRLEALPVLANRQQADGESAASRPPGVIGGTPLLRQRSMSVGRALGQRPTERSSSPATAIHSPQQTLSRGGTATGAFGSSNPSSALFPPPGELLQGVDWLEEQRRTHERLERYRRAKDEAANQAAEEEALRRRQFLASRTAQKTAKERHREEIYAINSVLKMCDDARVTLMLHRSAVVGGIEEHLPPGSSVSESSVGVPSVGVPAGNNNKGSSDSVILLVTNLGQRECDPTGVTVTEEALGLELGSVTTAKTVNARNNDENSNAFSAATTIVDETEAEGNEGRHNRNWNWSMGV